MLSRVAKILAASGEPRSPLRATELYNEGWMLRLLLDWAQQSHAPADHPFRFAPGARWFSEALLPSQFLARKRGDPLAETWTNADGAVGQFDIGESGKGDLVLLPEASQLVVIEAKMFSGLSAGTRRAPGYDQAARNVACIAEVLARAGRSPHALASLAFYVLAPKVQIERGIFGDLVTKESIRNKVQKRVSSYQGEKDDWFDRSFVPTLDRVDLGLLSWDEILPNTDEYGDFYQKCLRFNSTRPGIRSKL